MGNREKHQGGADRRNEKGPKALSSTQAETWIMFGAGNETRTRDPDLGKVVLYQLSYSRVTTCCPFGRNRTFDA